VLPYANMKRDSRWMIGTQQRDRNSTAELSGFTMSAILQRQRSLQFEKLSMNQ